MNPSRIETRAGTLAYSDSAGGPPLVVLHAFPLDSEMWQPQIAALAGRTRILAVDLPGFGGSPPASPFSIDSAADTVAAFLDALQVRDRVVLGGLSMGGYVTLAFARRHANRLAGLILADTRSEPDDDAGKQARDKMIALVKAKGAAAVFEQMRPRVFSDQTREHRSELVDAVQKIAERQSPEGIAAALTAMRDRPDATPGLESIAVPTLILVGAHDAVTPPTLASEMAARIWGSQVVTIPDAGHLSNLENPEAFNNAVIEFLAQLAPASRPANT